MNPQKLFNYIIQHWETYNNVAILKEIIYIINNKETKLVLYTYDAFALDVAKEDKDKIREVFRVFESRGFLYKVKKGFNYDEIK
jgi:hypothetical protein